MVTMDDKLRYASQREISQKTVLVPKVPVVYLTIFDWIVESMFGAYVPKPILNLLHKLWKLLIGSLTNLKVAATVDSGCLQFAASCMFQNVPCSADRLLALIISKNVWKTNEKSSQYIHEDLPKGSRLSIIYEHGRSKRCIIINNM